MTPTLKIYDPADFVLANSEKFGESRLPISFGIPKSYFLNLGFGEFCANVFYPLVQWLSVLIARIVVVVFARAQKQMGRISALSIVAMMKHPKSVWNFSTIYQPRQPVRGPVTTPPTNLTITTDIKSSNPWPAFTITSAINVLPKNIRQRFAGVNLSPSEFLDCNLFPFEAFEISEPFWHLNYDTA